MKFENNNEANRLNIAIGWSHVAVFSSTTGRGEEDKKNVDKKHTQIEHIENAVKWHFASVVDDKKYGFVFVSPSCAHSFSFQSSSR